MSRTYAWFYAEKKMQAMDTEDEDSGEKTNMFGHEESGLTSYRSIDTTPEVVYTEL